MEKAIKHLKNTFSKERIYRKKEDLDALNDIIVQYNEMEQKSLKRNKLFVKLFINEFLRHTELSGRTSAEAIKEIHNLLEITTEEYYFKMRKEIPYLRFKAVSYNIGLTPLYEEKNGTIRVNNDEETIKRNDELINKHQKHLTRALTTEYTEEQLKGFLHQYMHQTILKYSSYD